jgi:anti-anti-sigma factor
LSLRRFYPLSVGVNRRGAGRATDSRRWSRVQSQDLASAPSLQTTCALVPVAAPVLLDLHGCGFIDSVGLNAIFNARRERELAGAGLSVARPSEPVRRLFEITAAHRQLGIHDTIGEGLAALRRSQPLKGASAASA